MDPSGGGALPLSHGRAVRPVGGRRLSIRTEQRIWQSSIKKTTNFQDAQERISNLVETAKVLKAHHGSLTKSSWVIDPRTSTFTPKWDIVASCALAFTAVGTPFEVGFLSPSVDATDPLFILNRVVDGIFLVDLVLQFFIMYAIHTPGMNNEQWVGSLGAIARHYLLGWFTIDFLSIAPSIFDIPGLLGDADSGSGAKSVKVLRICLRMLRLTKMVRLIRSSRFLKRAESHFPFPSSIINLFKCIAGTLLVAHWLACIWGMQTSFQETRTESWMGDRGYCTEGPDGEIACDDPGKLYSAALYWSCYTITSIGYGDITPNRDNAQEMAVCAILMVISSIFWGLILSSLIDNATRLNQDAKNFSKGMDDLNEMMAMYCFPEETRVRMREYLQEARHLHRAERHKQVLASLSPTLRAEAGWLTHKSWVRSVAFLKQAPKEFLGELALRLEAKVYAKDELAPLGYICVIQRGSVVYMGRVLAAGKVWGFDSILADERFHFRASALALTYVEVYRISGQSLRGVAHKFPDVRDQVRWAAIRIALHRYLLIEASAKREGTTRDEAIGMLQASGMFKEGNQSYSSEVSSASFKQTRAPEAEEFHADSERGRAFARVASQQQQLANQQQALTNQQNAMAAEMKDVKEMLSRLLDLQQTAAPPPPQSGGWPWSGNKWDA